MKNFEMNQKEMIRYKDIFSRLQEFKSQKTWEMINTTDSWYDYQLRKENNEYHSQLTQPIFD